MATVHTARDLMTPTEIVRDTARCDTIIPRIREDGSLKVVVVVDRDDKPVGILERIETLTSMANPLAYAVFQNRPVSTLMEEDFFSFPVDGDMSDLSYLINESADSIDTGGVVLLENGRCAGVLLYSDFLGYMVRQDAERAKELAEAHEVVMESVNYASRIQQGLLGDADKMRASFTDVGIVWEPRDVVGGDIFWQSPKREDGMFWVALVDCTGHGVPGAMVSMLVASALNRLWVTHNDLTPGEVLAKLGDLVRQALNQDSDHATSNDGFDSAIVRIDPVKDVITYAGARIGLFVVPRDHEPVVRVNGFKMALGYKGTIPHKPLPDTQIHIPDVAAVVMATDGLFDQPGGPNARAFGPTRLADFLGAHRAQSASELANNLRKEVTHWRGEESRRDDLSALVLGF